MESEEISPGDDHRWISRGFCLNVFLSKKYRTPLHSIVLSFFYRYTLDIRIFSDISWIQYCSCYPTKSRYCKYSCYIFFTSDKYICYRYIFSGCSYSPHRYHATLDFLSR